MDFWSQQKWPNQFIRPQQLVKLIVLSFDKQDFFEKDTSTHTEALAYIAFIYFLQIIQQKFKKIIIIRKSNLILFIKECLVDKFHYKSEHL